MITNSLEIAVRFGLGQSTNGLLLASIDKVNILEYNDRSCMTKYSRTTLSCILINKNI